MAPNFNLTNVSLFECSAADLELITPVSLNVKSAGYIAPAAPPVSQPAAEAEEISSNYWEDDSSSHDGGMTVEQMERKKAALARVQARIEARRAASVQPHEFSVAAVEESLVKDAESRSSQSVESDSKVESDDYWNECVGPLSAYGRMGEESHSEAENYWTMPASDCDGVTVESLEARRRAVLRFAESMRLHGRSEEFRSKANELDVVSMAPCVAATGSSYWDC